MRRRHARGELRIVDSTAQLILLSLGVWFCLAALGGWIFSWLKRKDYERYPKTAREQERDDREEMEYIHEWRERKDARRKRRSRT